MAIVEKLKTEKVNLRRGEDYLEALNDGRRVYAGGEKIENVATHPITRDYARRIADYYDLHFDPELRDIMTYVDENGVRCSRQFQLPHSKEELVARRRFHETVSKTIGAGNFGRLPDASTSVLFTLIDDPDPWEKASVGTEGRGLADNIRRFWAKARDNNWNTVPLFIDTQPDRSSPDAFKTSPDLKLISSDDEGITVNGLKAVSTGAIFAEWCLVGLFFRPGVTPEQCLFFFVQPNHPGLTIIGRRGAAATPGSCEADIPLSILGDELDSFQIFDNVKIPWSQVVHIGNVEHAKHYPQRIFDWLHYEDLVRQSVKAELMAGLAILLGELTGTIKIPAMQMRIADVIRFREAVRAHIIAADDTGFMTPGGLYKPNNLLFDFGRAYCNEEAPRFVQEVVDMAGRGPMMIPDDADWKNPDLKKWLEPMFKGPSSDSDKLKIFRVVRDLFITEWGRRNAMFDQFNGTPLTAVRILTMMRAEYQADAPITELARRVCGLPAIKATKGKMEAAAYVNAQDVKTA